ncbi:MAG: O-antigen ligase family protein [Candidatus Saccharibacteria bacterium]|nr:O-antigen ligase family protein [Candidatus Saccharibacteria bacterium]
MVRKSTVREHRSQQRSNDQKGLRHVELGSATGSQAQSVWKHIPLWGSYALLVYMPFHIFLSQWLSTFTGGLEAWKIAKDVITLALVVVSLGLVLWTGAYKQRVFIWAAGLSVAYVALHIITYAINQDTTPEVAALATVYNNRLLWYLIIGLSAWLLTPKSFTINKITKLVLIVSTITAGLGVLQYFAPANIMTYFGYSLDRGVWPAFFIDSKPDLPRIMSTVRDPNSYGAYLILPLTLLWTLLLQSLKVKSKKYKAQVSKLKSPVSSINYHLSTMSSATLLLSGLFMLHGLALFLTFSRSAWIGAFVSLVIVSLVAERRFMKQWFKRLWPFVTAAIFVLAFGILMLRDTYVVQNIIFHADDSTTAEMDSNALHIHAPLEGLRQAGQKPQGYGPGTAGIVSIQNESGSFLTENYYIQILHEVGIAGLAVFGAALLFVVRQLRVESKLGAALFASFWGYFLMSMIMHLWTNEAVAAQWWLAAGLLIGAQMAANEHKPKRQN